MKRPLDKPVPRQLGSISADEAMPLRELSRRFGWGRRQQADAVKDGLPAVVVGRQKFVLGADAIDWFRRLGQKQTGQQANNTEQ